MLLIGLSVLAATRVRKLLSQSQDALEQSQETETAASANDESDGDNSADQIRDSLLLQHVAVGGRRAHVGHNWANLHRGDLGAVIHADDTEPLAPASLARLDRREAPVGPVARLCVALFLALLQVFRLAKRLDKIAEDWDRSRDDGAVVERDVFWLLADDLNDLSTVLNLVEESSERTSSYCRGHRPNRSANVNHGLASALHDLCVVDFQRLLSLLGHPFGVDHLVSNSFSVSVAKGLDHGHGLRVVLVSGVDGRSEVVLCEEVAVASELNSVDDFGLRKHFRVGELCQSGSFYLADSCRS